MKARGEHFGQFIVTCMHVTASVEILDKIHALYFDLNSDITALEEKAVIKRVKILS